MIEGVLRAYYFQLRLSVEDYEFPHFTTGRERNALACQVVVEDTEIGDSYLRHSPTLYNFELASFTEQLRALQREGSGQAVVGDADPESGDEFGLTISLNDDTGTLAGFIGKQGRCPSALRARSISTGRSSPTRSRSSMTSSRPSPFAATSPPTEPHHQRRSIFDRRSGVPPVNRGDYATERPA